MVRVSIVVVTDHPVAYEAKVDILPIVRHLLKEEVNFKGTETNILKTKMNIFKTEVFQMKLHAHLDYNSNQRANLLSKVECPRKRRMHPETENPLKGVLVHSQLNGGPLWMVTLVIEWEIILPGKERITTDF